MNRRERIAALRRARNDYRRQLAEPRIGGRDPAELHARIRLVEAELRRGPLDEAEADRRAIDWLAQATTDQLRLAWRPNPVGPLRRFEALDSDTARAVIAEIHRSVPGRLGGLRAIRSNQVDDLRFSASVIGPTLHPARPSDTEALLRIDWWRRRPVAASPGPVVPVLLPVRLETRFELDGSGWRLRLLVVPDEAWFDSHDPRPNELEVEALKRWWDEQGGDRSAAFRHLAAAAGGARAAWLAATFTAPADLETVEIVASDRFRPANAITGFPPELALHVSRSGLAPVELARWPVEVERLVIELTGRPDTEPQWWNDFTLATEVGLGIEVDLGSVVDDIDAVFVTGLGEHAPVDLFQRHRASGRLGIVPLGTATNTVEGEPGAGEEPSVAQWLTLAGLSPTPAEMDLAELLCGDAAALGALPGGQALGGTTGPSLPALAEAMTSILWPALWGHALADLWNAPDSLALGLAELAAGALRPDGYAHAVRVGDQPYGVVVATDGDRWVSSADEPPLLADLAAFVERELDRFVTAGESAGTVEGASTRQLLDLIGRTPISGELRTRHLLPSGIALWFLRWFGGDVDGTAQELKQRTEEVNQFLETVFGQPVGPPSRTNLAYGQTRILDLTIIEPNDIEVAVALAELIDSIKGRMLLAFDQELADALPLSDEPSLFVRLMLRSARVAVAAIGRTLAEEDHGWVGPEPIHPVLEGLWLFHDPNAFGTNPDDPRLTRMQRWILRAAKGEDSHRASEDEQLDRLTQSLRSLSGLPIDELERVIRGLLDSASHRFDPWASIPAQWRLDLLMGQAARPRRALGAYGWVDRPRPRPAGTHPAAGGLLFSPSEEHALTAAILRDRAVAAPGRFGMELTSTVVQRARRLAAAVRVGTHPAEHLGAEVERIVDDPALVEQLRTAFPLRSIDGVRRVCNGQAVLTAAVDVPASLGLPSPTVQELINLAGTTDGYADLLLAEAAFRVVTGRGERAGPALDAAAGLGPPPELEILRNDRTGQTVTTVVAVVVDPGAAPVLPPDEAGRAATAPLSLAEPAIESYLADTVATLGPWRWTVEDGTGTLVTFSLADLGLTPSESLAYSAEELESAVAQRSKLIEPRLVDRSGSGNRAVIGRLVRLVTDGPAASLDTDVDAPAAADRRLRDLLVGRAADVTAALTALTVRLSAANDDGAARGLLASAARWGVPAALTDPDDPVAAANSAGAELNQRLAATPAGLATAALVDVAAALRALVGPRGNMAHFSPTKVADLRATAPPIDPVEFNEGWLAAVAAVRSPLARLEAARLEGIGPRDLRLSDPAHPWPIDGAAPPHVVVWTSVDLDGADPGDGVALAVVDRFTETVPDPGVNAASAFGFDAPKARAQQVVIVAVPADRDAADPPDVIGVVEQVRRLTRVRAAVPQTLDEAAGPLPLTGLPMYGPTGVRLHKEDDE